MTPRRGLGPFAWLLVPVMGLVGCWQTTPPSTPPAPRPVARPTPEPTPVAVNAVVELSSQSFHTCARRQAGDVLCWGKNTYGQLGAFLFRSTTVLFSSAKESEGRRSVCGIWNQKRSPLKTFCKTWAPSA